ncbi:hypothetical protein C8Q78DRAFT_1011494 [Trametes maxima]|nr:hypothetical protein C8Q78DRAFT_1011494 [Trametes maxima]
MGSDGRVQADSRLARAGAATVEPARVAVAGDRRGARLPLVAFSAPPTCHRCHYLCARAELCPATPPAPPPLLPDPSLDPPARRFEPHVLRTLATMQLSSPLLLILAALGAVEATSHVHAGVPRHHNALARSDALTRRGQNGRCKVRPTSSLASAAPAAETTHAKPAALNNKNADKGASANNDNNNKNQDAGKSNDSGKGNDSGKSNDSGNKSGSDNNTKSVGHVNGLIAINDSSCGWPGATKDITATAGPNGAIDWLNCGVEDGGGWRPPYVKVSDIVAVDLGQAIQDPHSPFKACSAYIETFTRHANEHGIPPILVASIAMQESSCNPETVGGAGEQGLMQITRDKCGGAPGGNCRDVEFNVAAGVSYFASVLNANGGSLLKTLGAYNGWNEKMTVSAATAAAHEGCCPCQNNLDYLMQTMNGWVLNKDPRQSSPRIGKYFNLDQCYNY